MRRATKPFVHPLVAGGVMAIAFVAIGLALTAAPAAAHAEFVTSDPAPGARLGTPPRTVVMWFGEPLVAELSSASVRDPQGSTVRGGAVGDRRMRVELSTSVPGVYEVRWKTVSPLDGHTREGSFRFGVGTDAASGSSGATPSDAPATSDLWIALARALEYGALLLGMGYSVLVSLARPTRAVAWAAHRRRAVTVAFVAGLLVVGGEATLAAGLSTGGIVDFFATRQGRWRLARLVLEAALVGSATVRRSALVVVVLVGTFVALAGTGHAAAVQPRWWAIFSDSLHLVAAGMWAGTIGAFFVSRAWRRLDRAERGALLARFTPVAVVAFIATIGFGVIRATQELGAVRDLSETGYGGALLAKVTLVAVMVPLSILAWRRRRVARTEAIAASVVVMLAALLAAFPTSPGRAETDEGDAARSEGEVFRPAAGDLTMGGRAGDALVALTLRPGELGANDVFLTVVPARGAPGPRPSEASLSVDGSPRRLRECGSSCLRASAVVDGGDRVDVALDDGTGVTFELPEIPTSDATALVDRSIVRMNALDSYRLDEVFGPLDPPLRSTWEIVAPNRLHITFDDGRELIRIADRSWRREAPDDTWSERDTPRLRVPSHIWDVADRRAARVLGTETVEGQPTTIVSVYGESAGSATPLWYRLWVDDEGLVRRAEMRAPGHFMDHRYYDFDARITVEPPTAR